ncbi:hypothetical protein [Puia dinghuensis]|uniref:hypothetical protein n=1 Tax=Puia dinghuensis TaxID=1792502 RepID=UPI0016666FEA|nr:hypothetical protein [Puia dinghuensis]
MKKLFILSAVIAASLIATKGYSQVFVSAHVGFRIPGPRVYVAPAPVVYEQPAPVYDGGYYAAPQVCESDFPGYAYYTYPAWCGHYRDRVYFEHYRPYFERDYGGYYYGGRFDYDRCGRDHGWRGHEWREHEWHEDHDRDWHHDHGWHRGWYKDREDRD